MSLYTILLTNQLTSETKRLTVEATDPRVAQEQALVSMFRAWGWRKAVAGIPVMAEVCVSKR